jgi:hypothetical protein
MVRHVAGIRNYMILLIEIYNASVSTGEDIFYIREHSRITSA